MMQLCVIMAFWTPIIVDLGSATAIQNKTIVNDEVKFNEYYKVFTITLLQIVYKPSKYCHQPAFQLILNMSTIYGC